MRNTWKVSKCGAGEGWKSFGLITWNMQSITQSQGWMEYPT